MPFLICISWYVSRDEWPSSMFTTKLCVPAYVARTLDTTDKKNCHWSLDNSEPCTVGFSQLDEGRRMPKFRANSGSGPIVRLLVREKVRELDERKKRRCSLVIRGLETTSAEEAARRFSDR